jgi:competence protein ComEC
LRNKGAPVQSALLKVRRKLQGILDKHLTAFEAGVIQSLVLGGRYYIPQRTRELFVQTGTAHILAISGMNVGGMAFLVFLILNVLRLPRRAQITGTCSILVVYCFLTGADPSVVRATVMAVVMLCGLLFERQTDTLNSLGLAAIIILLFDPMALFAIGFQLSFMGVLAIVCIYPKIYRLFEGRSSNRAVTVVLQSLCISLAAWIGVLPLVAYYFEIVTPVSILANIPIIPFVSALFMLGFGLILTGLCCPSLAGLFALCIKIVLFLLMMIVDSFSKIPAGYFYIPRVDLYLVAGYYLAVGVIFFILPFFPAQEGPNKNLHFLS